MLVAADHASGRRESVCVNSCLKCGLRAAVAGCIGRTHSVACKVMEDTADVVEPMQGQEGVTVPPSTPTTPGVTRQAARKPRSPSLTTRMSQMRARVVKVRLVSWKTQRRLNLKERAVCSFPARNAKGN